MEKASGFVAGYATEDEIRNVISDVYHEQGYLMDTHTAAGYKVYRDRKEETDAYSVVLSTASAYKFSKDVYEAIFGKIDEELDDVQFMYRLNEKTGVPIPKVIDGIENFERREEEVITSGDMPDSIRRYIGKK